MSLLAHSFIHRKNGKEITFSYCKCYSVNESHVYSNATEVFKYWLICFSYLTRIAQVEILISWNMSKSARSPVLVLCSTACSLGLWGRVSCPRTRGQAQRLQHSPLPWPFQKGLHTWHSHSHPPTACCSPKSLLRKSKGWIMLEVWKEKCITI